ncbi:tRNA lysidine(34) synthetase TilS [Anaerosporobacter faecicola]|uniref:tRNA lysidine(34) synthetase TilS n=1 Tax=Anaerosporobacter faecicola TaxID=2718714 RepID=UPI00143B7D44|nr:tRNA lysidine(34) synthetase TilS [Anaerosporobacter faecicola]
MLNKVRQYIDANHMLAKKAKVVLGVSGGADSVCLFFVMLALRESYDLTLYVVHVNHMIRGEEADRDQRYVEQLCAENQVTFHCIKEDVKEVAKKEHLSEEEAGREVRYKAFEEIRMLYGCDVIAVAHNSNDCAETMLFQLARGSGITGLTSIPPKRGHIIRPLLMVTRAEIEAYLKDRKIAYQTDETNLETVYARNRIRLDIMPYLEQHINKQAVAHMVKTAQMLTEVEEFIEKQEIICYNRLVQIKSGIYHVELAAFQREDPVIQKAMVRHILQELAGKLKDIERVHIEEICNLVTKGVGKKVDLPYGMVAYNDYKDLMICMKEQMGKVELEAIRQTQRPVVEESLELLILQKEVSIEQSFGKLKIPGLLSSEEYQITYAICPVEDTLQSILQDKMDTIWDTNENVVPDFIRQLSNQSKFYEEYKKSMINARNGYTKCFDYDKIKNAVQLRTRREGDYMQINAYNGTKKLKALLVDQKVPREQRSHIPLLADGSHIMWIPGSRISEAYKISESTRTILIVYLFGGK